MTLVPSDVEARVKNACDRFTTQDSKLLDFDASERSMTHKLAEYLQQEFPGWDVDCEYNRDIQKPKSMPWEGCSHLPYKRRRILPDIVIHKRGSDENLIVIEAKKSNNRNKSNHDSCKMKVYKSLLGYRFGYFVTFPIGKGTSSSLDVTEFS